MTERYQKRGIRTGPPLVAGIYRQLNVGMDAFSQCKKVVDTPFPWPYAQCVMVAIIFFMVSFPVQVNRTLNYVACLGLGFEGADHSAAVALQCCEVINDDFLAPFVSFTGVFVIAMVNVVACELEEPFMDDTNGKPSRLSGLT